MVRALHAATALVCVASLALALSGCGEDEPEIVLDAQPYDPVIRAADFASGVENPYFPLRVGTIWVYEGDTDDGREKVQVEVTDQTRDILGVACIVVRDRVWIDGELEEDTLDWYAVDNDGNIWYFGEDSKEMRGGKVVGTGGSWEAGVGGAKPGIVMKAQPHVGDAYRQEYLKGEAEDMAEVLSLSASATVKFGSYKDTLQTKEWTPLEPDVVEHKFYAKGVGLVLETVEKGGEGRVELISVTQPE
ncbi:hypothetical protein FJZ36_09730 [Candidatus Poribacteria bacterium]|nr:hypothetical protein [Candidatus Poribacteria bacterium]